MKNSGLKFNIERIANLIVDEVEQLMTDAVIVADDYDSLKDKFHKILNLKKKYNLESIDIVFIWKNSDWDEKFDKQTYKEEIAEIYNRVNYKLGESKAISTFFRGAEKTAPSFHFPAGLNIWFLEVNQFVKSKVKPIVLFDFGAKLSSYLNKFNTKEDKDLFNDIQYYFVEVDDYFNLDRHIAENWNKQ